MLRFTSLYLALGRARWRGANASEVASKLNEKTQALGSRPALRRAFRHSASDSRADSCPQRRIRTRGQFEHTSLRRPRQLARSSAAASAECSRRESLSPPQRHLAALLAAFSPRRLRSVAARVCTARQPRQTGVCLDNREPLLLTDRDASCMRSGDERASFAPASAPILTQLLAHFVAHSPLGETQAISCFLHERRTRKEQNVSVFRVLGAAPIKVVPPTKPLRRDGSKSEKYYIVFGCD